MLKSIAALLTLAAGLLFPLRAHLYRLDRISPARERSARRIRTSVAGLCGGAV